MSQKNFTSHGHPIPGAPYRPDQQPRNVARCGGPGLCPDCSREAGQGNRKNRMTSIDYHQTAIRAVADALHGDACPVDPDPGESCGCGDYEREAEIALTVALPIIEKQVRGETLVEVVQAHRDLHKTYGSTSVCRGGIGGQTLMPHCAEVCDNPRAHDGELTKWQALELEAINYSHAARIVQEGG